MLDDLTTTPHDPSMALIRQLVMEYVIFPLGSELIRKRHPANVRSILFYGPEGTGKTLMVRAIASETKSVIFDLSPVATLGQYVGGRPETDKMVAMVMKAAKAYQPSIIYIDETEKVFPAKGKKGKKGKKKGGKKNAMTEPSRIKKALTKWKAKWITDETRITIIGCTSDPENGSKKDFKKFYDRSLYFPFPDYTTSRLMWKTFIEQAGGFVTPDFGLNTLAHISYGYSAGSIRKTCEFVLTPFRISKLSERPLKISEFVGRLSQCANTMEDAYKAFQGFTDFISGDASRRKAILAAIAGDDDGANPKDKKKKKKKK
jgi:SpoVK/Ycf46/Vps4 family AAA+-type ATPase